MRLFIALFSAVCTAFALLLFMANLVSFTEINGPERPTAEAPDILPPEPLKKTPTKPEVPDKPTLVLSPGPTPDGIEIEPFPVKPQIGEWLPKVLPTLPSGDPGIAFNGDPKATPQAVDGLIPVSTMTPLYPTPAAQQGIEGFVTLSFKVLSSGKVADVTIVDAKPRGVFEKAAIKALSRWIYRPHAEEAIAQSVTLDFKLQP